MNQEWKFKLHSVYGQILFDRKLTQSFEQEKANKGVGGIDGETIESCDAKLQENIMALLDKLRSKTYQAQPVRRAITSNPYLSVSIRKHKTAEKVVFYFFTYGTFVRV